MIPEPTQSKHWEEEYRNVFGLCELEDGTCECVKEIKIMENADNKYFENPFTWKCPHCGVSDYSPRGGFTTLMYFEPRYVNGVDVNPDRNTTTYTNHCNGCGKDTEIIS